MVPFASRVTFALNGRLPRIRTLAVALAPLFIVAMALGLRLYGIDWDQGHLYHPDERAILMRVEALSPPPAGDLALLLDVDESPWNPRWFPYGSFPLYLLKGVQLLAEPFAKWNVFDLRLPGRAISALADTLTVLMVFVIGTRLYGRRVGLLASAFVALAVVHIQLSHFYTVDTILTLMAVLSIFFLVRVARDGRLRDSALAGLFLGLGLATKVSLAPMLLPFVLAHAMYAFSRDDERLQLSSPDATRLMRSLSGVALGGGVLLLAMFVTQPYGFLDWARFLSDNTEQSEMVRRILDYPYTRQYIDTTPYWYQIRQLGTWGLGLPLGIVAWSGLIAGTAYALAKKRKAELLILAWVIPYFAITGAFQVKFLRYLLPITPFLILMGSWALLKLYDWMAQMRPRLKPWLAGGIAMLVVATGLYALAYSAIYSRPHPASQASEWINDQAPRGSLVLQEHWEEGIPNLGGYRVEQLPMYEFDGPFKVELVSQKLADADFLAFYSHRLYGTIPRLPERYPISSAYYRLLFSGELGYKLARVETSYPGFLGISLADSTFSRPGLPTPVGFTDFAQNGKSPLTLSLGFADESFTVYDHPTVLIFCNESHLTKERLAETLLLGGYTDGAPLGSVFSPEDARIQQEGGTWSEIISRTGWTNSFPLAVWLLLIEGLGLLVLPIAFFLFRPLYDRGYLLSKVLGLLLVPFVVWILVSLRWASFSQPTIWLAFILVGLVSLGILLKTRGEMLAFVRQRWRVLLIGEILFLVAFLAFYLIRLANPDLWHFRFGGEKPMDFAYLNAVLKSTYMPPYDPWFSGGFINYYYYGQFMVATIIKATGINPAVAYNLAVPLFFALTASAAFALVYNLAEGTRRRRGFPGLGWTPVVAGIAGALFVVVLANLDGMWQVAQGTGRALFGNQPFGVFDFWLSRSMMPPDPPGFEITEFPFFTFLYGDLHAHLMALPFTLLVLGLLLALILRPRAEGPGAMTWGRSVWEEGALLLVLSLAVGSLRPTNFADYPTYMAIAAGGILLAEYYSRGGLSFALLLRGAAKVGLVFLMGYILFLPYHSNYEPPFSGIGWTTNQTALWQFLAIHGLFVFIIISFLGREAWVHLASGFRSRVRLKVVAFSLIALAGAITALALFPDYSTVGFVGLMLLATLAVGLRSTFLWRADSPLLGFPLLLMAAAFSLAIGVEFLRQDDDLDRMNTVFKSYFQIWVLLALASAYLLWRLVQENRGPFRRTKVAGEDTEHTTRRPVTGRVLRIAAISWLALLLLLLVSVSIYPVMGTQVKLRTRFQTSPLTADGMSFMRETVYHNHKGSMELKWDYQAIRWLQDNVEGSPVILEGITPLYYWGNRVSIYTGLPAIIGWDWHQIQQRTPHDGAVRERRRDVNQIYGTPSQGEALELMRKYGVRYVYVGPLERLYYPQWGVDKFEGMVGRSLSRVYENSQVTIYRLL